MEVRGFDLETRRGKLPYQSSTASIEPFNQEFSNPSKVMGVPLPLVVYSPPSGQGSLWSTQEGDMFEQTDSALVMTLLALGGIALMADEKLGSSCLQMVKWIRTRGRH